MAKSPKIKVTITEITKGMCSQGYKVGDSWIIEDGKTPTDMCASAYYVAYPTIRTLRFGGDASRNEKDTDVTYIPCPDRNHWVIYEVKKLTQIS